MVIFSVVSGACKSILIILISNLLTSWFLGALSVFHILTFEMNFCTCTWAFMSHALIGRWTHSTSLRSLLWVHARNANTFTWLTFKWTQLQSCTETQSVKDPHLSWAYTWSAVPVSPASVLGAGAAAACGTQLKEAAAVFGRRRAGEAEQSPICGEAPVSSARRGGRSESEQEELQPVWSQREGGSSDNRAALPRVVNTFIRRPESEGALSIWSLRGKLNIYGIHAVISWINPTFYYPDKCTNFILKNWNTWSEGVFPLPTPSVKHSLHTPQSVSTHLQCWGR